MSHQTFAIITCTVKSEDQFLLLKNEAGENHFFVWLDRAMNGSHRWEYFDRHFQEYFKVTQEIYESFLRERIAIDKADKDNETSKALVKISVSETFHEKTKEEESNFLWVNAATIQNLIKSETDFRQSEKWIARYLFRHPLDVVSLPTQLFEAIKKIQEAREKNKLVIFAGAGISVDSGAPLWWETGTEILRSLGLSESIKADAPVIGQWLFNERGEKEYNEKLREILRYHKGLQPNPIHRQLLRLRPRHLITTNYDDLLEQALNEHQRSAIGKQYAIIRRDEDLPYAITDEYIVKMHGDWDVMNFVFKEDDYLNYSRNFPLIESFVKGIFSSHLVLFVGFSFSDPNLKQIVNWVKEILGKDFQPAYLFQTKEPGPHEANYFGNKGIRPAIFHESISSYLEEMDDNRRGMGKSEIGRKTYDFLRLLELLNCRDYERLKRAKSQHVIDQMHESLFQFDAFNCIPPHSFEKLFPFSPTSLHPAKTPMNADHETGYQLQTSNEEIISLMEGLNFKDNRILPKQGSKGKKAIEQVPDFESKLAYVFDKLRSSQIHCIQRKGDPNNHNRILYGTQFEEKLLFSRWLSFQYKPMLEFIYSREWDDSEQSVRPLRDRLLDATVLTRFHFFLEAYTLYSSISAEALKRQDYPIFFICQYNKKYLGIRVLRIADWKKYPKDLVGQVRDEIDTIDLHGLLRTIQPEGSVKELLSGVLEKELFDRYSREIRKAHKEVLKFYKFFQNSGNQSSGSNDASILIENYVTLHWVFHSNGILLGWDESKFAELTELAFEGMVVSLCTSERNRGRLEAVEAEVLVMVCHFLDTEKIEKILDSYKPETLPLKTEEEKSRIMTLATNWFTSCFDEGVFLIEPRENDFLSRYWKDKLYSSELEQLSDNFFLLLSYMDLTEMQDKEDVEKLLNVTLKALTASNHVRCFWKVKYFLKFMERNIRLFNTTQIEWALRAITEYHGYKHSFGFRLARLFKKEKVDFQLTSEQILTEFFAKENNPGRRVEDFIFLYPFLSNNLQKILSVPVEELSESNDADDLMLWLVARTEGMFPELRELSKTQMQVLQNSFVEMEKISFGKDGSIENWNRRFSYSIVCQLGTLHYQRDIGLGKKTVQKLLKLESLPAPLRWMLDPKGFDYKNFNCYWVFFYDGALVLSKIGAMKISQLQAAFHRTLKEEYSPELAKIYFEYFADLGG